MSSGTPVQVRLPDSERDALDRYRRRQLNPPSRARAARDLISRALADDQTEESESTRSVSNARSKLEEVA